VVVAAVKPPPHLAIAWSKQDCRAIEGLSLCVVRSPRTDDRPFSQLDFRAQRLSSLEKMKQHPLMTAKIRVELTARAGARNGALYHRDHLLIKLA
jgi:hypothetical protein